MKIIILRHSLLSRGGDKMIVAHASHLAEQGHEVVIRTNRVDTVFRLHPRVRIEPLPYSGKAGTILSALLEKQRCDLVLADIIPLICLLWPRNRGRVRYFAQDYDESYYQKSWQHYVIRLLYAIGLGLFRVQTIAVAERLAQLLSRRFRAKVTVAENGVDTSVFYPETVAELLEGKGERMAILLLSRSDLRKGFDLGVSVIDQIAPALAGKFEVWTVGEPASQHFRGLPHRDFGYLDERRLRQVMSNADLLLYPSRHEGYPLMPLEAFACRCPVVTTEAVPYAEHGDNALVARIEDVATLSSLTLELCRNAETRGALAERGYRFAQAHSLKRSLEEFAGQLCQDGSARS